MTQHVNNLEPQEYIELLRSYFSAFPVKGEVFGVALAGSKERFNVQEQRSSLIKSENWRDFCDSVTEIRGIRKVREFLSSKHSLKILCALENSMSNGIGMYLSLLGNFYGLYYITESATDHIEYFGREFGADLSYFPLTDQQVKVSMLIEELIAKHFPVFQKFDNKWADYPVEMPMYLDFEEKSTLFKVLFEKDPGGVFF